MFFRRYIPIDWVSVRVDGCLHSQPLDNYDRNRSIHWSFIRCGVYSIDRNGLGLVLRQKGNGIECGAGSIQHEWPGDDLGI